MTRTYTTATKVKEEIRAITNFSSNTSPKLTTVNAWVQEETADIELRAGAIFGSNLETDQYFDYDGSGTFRFPDSNILSITTFSVNVNAMGTAASWVVLEEGYDKNYILYSEEAEVNFISGDSATNKILPKKGQKRFKITYSRGKDSTPLAVQKLCTLLVSKRVIQSLANSQSNSEGGTIQVGTIRVTEPGNYSLSYLKQMDKEIETLYNYIGQNLNTFRYVRVYD